MPTVPAVRCCVQVLIPGMAMPRYRQCSRMAVTTGPTGAIGEVGPVCRQHSPEAEAARKAKGELAFQQRMARWRTWDHAKYARANRA